MANTYTDKELREIPVSKYYENFYDAKKIFRKRVCDELSISKETFWRKIKTDDWSNAERMAIHYILQSMNNLINHDEV